jgi:undecaprenyl-diphosphatase
VEIVKAMILGAVQGLTEFLPISSSGHLVIGSQLLDFHEQGIAFEVFVHLGTLLAVVIFFRREILAMIQAPFKMFKGGVDEETRNYFLWDIYIIAATLPAVVVGLFFKENIEQFFTNLLLVYCMLAFTGVMMILSRYMTDRGCQLNSWRAFLIGCAQALAILPGLSRSGTTIFAGMAMGVNRVTVAKFSFIMSIPAILGAVVLQSSELLHSPPALKSMVTIGTGTLFSAVSGYFAIIFLMDLVKKNRLQWFGYYCLIISFIGFAAHLLK